MKFIHLSDLHLGKRVNEYSMLEDQEYILKEIIHIIDAEKPDGVMIAGDVYDKSVPSAEAVQLFDNFLVQLAKRSSRYLSSAETTIPRKEWHSAHALWMPAEFISRRLIRRSLSLILCTTNTGRWMFT